MSLLTILKLNLNLTKIFNKLTLISNFHNYSEEERKELETSISLHRNTTGFVINFENSVEERTCTFNSFFHQQLISHDGKIEDVFSCFSIIREVWIDNLGDPEVIAVCFSVIQIFTTVLGEYAPTFIFETLYLIRYETFALRCVHKMGEIGVTVNGWDETLFLGTMQFPGYKDTLQEALTKYNGAGFGPLPSLEVKIIPDVVIGVVSKPEGFPFNYQQIPKGKEYLIPENYLGKKVAIYITDDCSFSVIDDPSLCGYVYKTSLGFEVRRYGMVPTGGFNVGLQDELRFLCSIFILDFHQVDFLYDILFPYAFANGKRFVRLTAQATEVNNQSRWQCIAVYFQQLATFLSIWTTVTEPSDVEREQQDFMTKLKEIDETYGNKLSPHELTEFKNLFDIQHCFRNFLAHIWVSGGILHFVKQFRLVPLYCAKFLLPDLGMRQVDLKNTNGWMEIDTQYVESTDGSNYCRQLCLYDSILSLYENRKKGGLFLYFHVALFFKFRSFKRPQNSNFQNVNNFNNTSKNFNNNNNNNNTYNNNNTNNNNNNNKNKNKFPPPCIAGGTFAHAAWSFGPYYAYLTSATSSDAINVPVRESSQLNNLGKTISTKCTNPSAHAIALYSLSVLHFAQGSGSHSAVITEPEKYKVSTVLNVKQSDVHMDTKKETLVAASFASSLSTILKLELTFDRKSIASAGTRSEASRNVRMIQPNSIDRLIVSVVVRTLLEQILNKLSEDGYESSLIHHRRNKATQLLRIMKSTGYCTDQFGFAATLACDMKNAQSNITKGFVEGVLSQVSFDSLSDAMNPWFPPKKKEDFADFVYSAVDGTTQLLTKNQIYVNGKESLTTKSLFTIQSVQGLSSGSTVTSTLNTTLSNCVLKAVSGSGILGGAKSMSLASGDDSVLVFHKQGNRDPLETIIKMRKDKAAVIQYTNELGVGVEKSKTNLGPCGDYFLRIGFFSGHMFTPTGTHARVASEEKRDGSGTMPSQRISERVANIASFGGDYGYLFSCVSRSFYGESRLHGISQTTKNKVTKKVINKFRPDSGTQFLVSCGPSVNDMFLSKYKFIFILTLVNQVLDAGNILAAPENDKKNLCCVEIINCTAEEAVKKIKSSNCFNVVSATSSIEGQPEILYLAARPTAVIEKLVSEVKTLTTARIQHDLRVKKELNFYGPLIHHSIKVKADMAYTLSHDTKPPKEKDLMRELSTCHPIQRLHVIARHTKLNQRVEEFHSCSSITTLSGEVPITILSSTQDITRCKKGIEQTLFNMSPEVLEALTETFYIHEANGTLEGSQIEDFFRKQEGYYDKLIFKTKYEGAKQAGHMGGFIPRKSTQLVMATRIMLDGYVV